MSLYTDKSPDEFVDILEPHIGIQVLEVTTEGHDDV